jgi:FkbM family methyltransferase
MESKVEPKPESKTELSPDEKHLTPKPLPFNMFVETDLERWRRSTFWTKEPETLAWISSFRDYSIFYDIGANIGLYSLFCAKNHPKMTIFAFEPQLENYTRLCQNILLNGFRNIIPVYAGAGQINRVWTFMSSHWEIGSTGGKFGYFADKNSDLVYFNSDNPDTSFVRDGILTRIDDFSALFGLPTYIKIDTDGFEQEVLNGMNYTLRNLSLASILVEFDTIDKDKYLKGVKYVMHRGLNLVNQWNGFQPHSRDRRKEEGIQVENLIFSR